MLFFEIGMHNPCTHKISCYRASRRALTRVAGRIWAGRWGCVRPSARCMNLSSCTAPALRVAAGETNLKIKNCFGPTMGKHIAEDFKEWAMQYHIR